MITLSLAPYGPGIHRGMSFADYAAIKAVNKSSLALVATSPEDCLASLEGRYHRDSSGFAIGSALDDLMTTNMTPEQWSAAHPVASTCQATLASGDRKGEACGCETKNRFGDQWLCGKHGKGKPDAVATLTASDLVAINAMRKALLESSMAPLFGNMRASQLVVLWEDEETGLFCKARLDGVSVCQLPGYDAPCSIRWDLKTTAASGVHEFQRQANDLGYYLQDAHYTAGANAIAKLQGKEETDGNFVFAVACKAPSGPLGRHRVFPWTYDDATRQKAKEERKYLIRKLKDCLDRGEFPPEKIEAIQVGTAPDFIFSHLKQESMTP
jgi:hypothetical protein